MGFFAPLLVGLVAGATGTWAYLRRGQQQNGEQRVEKADVADAAEAKADVPGSDAEAAVQPTDND